MKILLTGVAGFIGSHSTRAFLNAGYNVIGIDNFNDYYDQKQKEKNISEFSENPNLKLYRADITDSDQIGAIVREERPDVLVHLAARAGVRPSIENPELYHEVNISGTLNLLEACHIHGITRAVLASSSSVYGNQKKIPFSENDFTENPISPYATTKRGMENLAYMYSKNHGMKITCLRFFTVYGPAGRPDMAPFLFTKWIDEGNPLKRFGDGTTKRDYTYIDDIVSGIVSAVNNPFDYEIINLGNNKPVELNEFIGTIEKLLEKKAIIQEMPNQPGDVPVTFADIEKAKKLLNYDPNTSIQEGMEKFVNWYKSQK